MKIKYDKCYCGGKETKGAGRLAGWERSQAGLPE